MAPENLPKPDQPGGIGQSDNQDKLTSLDKNFSVNFDDPIKSLSGEFTKAYGATAKGGKTREGRNMRQPCALVFERSFPPRIEMINFLQNLPNENGHMLSVMDLGVVRNKSTNSENLAVIMEQPGAKSLTEIFTGNPVPDKFLINNVITPLSEIIGSLAENRLLHGRLNADNVFFDGPAEKIIVGNCLSEPCGLSQPAIYEPLERVICHTLGKGDGDISADFYALGILILFMVTGKQPLSGVSTQDMIERRFESGSYTAMTQGIKLPTFVAELLKGLLSDASERRWGYTEVDAWMRKKASPPPPAINREAMRGFVFNGKDYFSTRYLAYVFARDYASVKHSLKMSDLSRWVKHSLLKPELAERFDTLLIGGRNSEAGIFDEDIARIVALLDPTGPIRLDTYAIDIYGFGPFLSQACAKNDRDAIQLVGNIFTSGLLQFWLEAVQTAPHQDDIRYQDLIWLPRKVLTMIRKAALGFGMERVLYDMNPSLPCQSPLLGNEYVDDLSQLLHTLDKIPKEKYETSDPVDRHIAGFIAAKIELREEITLKKLVEFPDLAQNPQMLMMALLLAAQTAAKVKNLKGLSAWMGERLQAPLQSIRSKNIRDEVMKSIKRAAREGNLQEVYNIATSNNYLRRDSFGFKEAKNYYKQLSERIHFLGKNDNNERLAYEYGLRYAMILSYLICTGTLIYLLTRI